jgi:ABC-type amino acid transport substrate-binding protein
MKRETRIHRHIFLFFMLALSLGITLSCGHKAETPNAIALHESVLDKVKREHVLRVGYSGYPPFLNVDIRTNKPSDGFSVELIQMILAQWDKSISIEWVPTNWTDVRTDLLNHKFDLIVEPVFRTIPRAAIVDFSSPYSEFSYAVGVVRANDNRYHTIKDLDNPNVHIALTQGTSWHEYATRNLPNATNLKIISGGKIEMSLDEVLLGRVDIALSDLLTAKRYVAAHPGKVKIIFTNPPPGRVLAGFMFRQDDLKFLQFLNTSLEFLQSSGETDRLKKKYDIE